MSTKILINAGTQASDSSSNEKRVFPTRFFRSSQHRRNSTKQSLDDVYVDPAIVKLIRDVEGMNNRRAPENARNRRATENKSTSDREGNKAVSRTRYFSRSGGNGKPRTFSYPGTASFPQGNRNNFLNRGGADSKGRRNGGYYNSNRGWSRQRTISSNGYRNQSFPYYNNFRQRSRSHYVTFFDPYFGLCSCYLPRNYNFQRMMNQNFVFNQRGFFPRSLAPGYASGRRYSLNGRFYNQSRRGQQQRRRTKSEGKGKQKQQQQSSRSRRRMKSNLSESAVSETGQTDLKQNTKTKKRTRSGRRRRNTKPRVDSVVKSTLNKLTRRVSAELSKAKEDEKEGQQVPTDSPKEDMLDAKDAPDIPSSGANEAATDGVAK